MAIIDKERVSGADLVTKGVPVEGDTVTIGADIYFFGTPTGGEIAVGLGGGASAWNNLVKAINENGTENVRASRKGQSVRIESADAPGGTPQVSAIPVALSAAFSSAAGAWDGNELSSTSEDLFRIVGCRTLSETDLEKDDIRVTLDSPPIFAEVFVFRGGGGVNRRWPAKFDGQEVVIRKKPRGRPIALKAGDIVRWEIYCK